jgi:hypothetical protein
MAYSSLCTLDVGVCVFLQHVLHHVPPAVLRGIEESSLANGAADVHTMTVPAACKTVNALEICIRNKHSSAGAIATLAVPSGPSSHRISILTALRCPMEALMCSALWPAQHGKLIHD